MITADAAGQGLHVVQGGERMMQGSDDKTIMPEEFLGAQGWHMSSQGLGKSSHRGLQLLGDQLGHEGLRLRKAPADHPNNLMAFIRIVLPDFKQWPGQCFKDKTQGSRRFTRIALCMR